MPWTDPSAAIPLFQTGDVFSESNFKTYAIDNLVNLGSGAHVTHSAAQTMTTSVSLALALNTERYDTGGFHDNVTNNSRLTVPAGLGGRYLIIGNAAFGANATGQRSLSILLNATGTIAATGVRAVSASSEITLVVSCVYSLAAGDFVQLMAFQDSGGNLDISKTTDYTPEFTIQGVGG